MEVWRQSDTELTYVANMMSEYAERSVFLILGHCQESFLN
jgi:hypothetical protein